MFITFIFSLQNFWKQLVKHIVYNHYQAVIHGLLFCLSFTCQAQLTAQWATMSGGRGNEINQTIAVDMEGNVYATGICSGNSTDYLDFGNGIDVHQPGAYLVKYNTDGVPQWARTLGSSTEGYGVATDAAGNVYVCGIFNKPAIKLGIAANVQHSGDGDDDIFLIKFDTNGNALWGKVVRSSEVLDDEFKNNLRLVVNDVGDVHLAGIFKRFYYAIIKDDYHILTYNGVQPVKVKYNGLQDIFVLKYDTDGEYQWAKSIGGAKNDQVKGIALDTEDNIYLTAYSESISMQYNNAPNAIISTLKKAADFPIVIETKGNTYLIKLDANGGKIMEKNFNVNYNERKRISLAVDGDQNIYMAGSGFSGNINFGEDLMGNNIELTSLYESDTYLVKYSDIGKPIWASNITNAGHVTTSIAVDAIGYLYLTGFFYTEESGEFSLDFGNDIYASLELQSNPYEEQSFLVQYNTDGQALWANAYGRPHYFDYDIGTDIEVDHENNIYLVGYARMSDGDAIDFGDGVLGAPDYIDPDVGGEQDMFLVKFTNIYAANYNQYPFGNDYEILTDVGVHPITELNKTESNGLLEKGLTLYNVGDKIKYNFEIEANGLFQIRARLRSGDVNDQASFWPDGYAFEVDNSDLAFSGVMESPEHYPSFIGNSWFGIMESESIYLEAGTHELSVEAMQAWAALDYFEIVPVEIETTIAYRKSPTNIEVYPNPILAGESTITLKSEFNVKDVQILSMEGNDISKEVSTIEIFSDTVEIHIKYTGLYFARIFLDNGESITKRLLVR
ncbi:SBBP repeat-containing protein [Chondrinema litorale]|uniref:SBBP repeat-containing protein n=1 Tax=Chondrinema litorale TaxID=2994555 RepID=UPI0025432D7A|nr:SBBP repeat-containing protein [Chondrinema litorale]UZR96326.1 SBBP repeat-containing protein [Chondrinema litorale]